MANMKAVQLLKKARENGILITLENEKLQLKVSKDKQVDAVFMEELRTYKSDILSFLHEEVDNFKNINVRTAKIEPFDRAAVKKIPLSFSQESTWLVDKLFGDVMHRVPMILKFEGKLNIKALEAALNEIVNRHEVFRTVIKEENGIAYQEIMPENNWQLQHTKVYGKNAEEKDQLVIAALDKRFNLSKDYMMRAHLFSFSESEHTLILVMHHIASDGWSEPIFSGEVVELYKAYSEGRHYNLPNLPLQYADYAVWQRNYMQGKVLEDRLAYWENKLSGLEPSHFPTDFTRPARQSTRGSGINLTLSRHLSEKLRELSKKEDVTLYMLFLSVLNVLVHRYSGDVDICIGSPVANRTQKEIELLIGYFVNTIAIRSDLSNNPDFRGFLKQVKKNVLEAYNYQDVPFEKIVNRVEKNRALDRHPVFQILFVLQSNEAVKDIELDDLVLSSNHSFTYGTAEFDLALAITDTPQGFGLRLSFCSDLFLPETISGILQHYESLLSEVVLNMDRTIGELKMLSEKEEQQLLTEFNNAKTCYPANKTVVDLFEEQVKSTPDNVAVVFNSSSLTYQQLNAKVNQLASYLISKGVKEEMPVAICIDRSIEMIIGMMAIMKAGGAYVAIPAYFPPGRIGYILEDTGAQILLTNSSALPLFKDFGPGTVIDIDRDHEVISKQPDINPARRTLPDKLIYMVYTSGSTGMPKAVMTEHHSLVNFLYAMVDVLKVNAGSSFLQLASYGFDGSCMEIYLPLIVGGKVIVVAQQAVTDGYLLQEIIRVNKPSFVQATPTALQLLADSGWDNKEDAVILSGGEPLRESLLKSLKNNSGRKVWNLYGPTEITLYATMKEMINTDRINVGKPIPNYSIYILDKYGGLVPVGVIGEIYVGGPGVARGYYNRPEQTNEKFVRNPFCCKEEDRLYRTGDLGKWTREGEIDFIGRKDNQIKIRGYRVEPAEIEFAIQKSEMVKRCIIIPKESAEGDINLIAYVIPTEQWDKEKLVSLLRESLPDYMVPLFFIELTSFPLTSNGKLDKSALPLPGDLKVSGSEHTEAGNETEQILSEIWKQLLAIETISIHDNFFGLGGNSLMAVRLMARVKERFGKQYAISVLFECPTIALLSSRLNLENDDRSSLIVAINNKGHKTPIFCAPAIGGQAISFYELSQALGEEQPVYGFIARGLDSKEVPHQTVGEMAAAYIVEMQKIDPVGPYRIAGYSFGGRTAYEIALQLHRKGFEVEQLIVFDSYAPDNEILDLSEVLPQTYKEWLMTVAAILNNGMLAAAGAKRPLDLSLNDFDNKSEEEQLRLFHARINDTGAEFTIEQLRGHVNVYITGSRLSYVPEKVVLNMPVILFKSTVEDNSAFDASYLAKMRGIESSFIGKDDYGWRAFTTNNVIIYEVECAHSNMMNKPHVLEMASILKSSLHKL